MIGYARVCQRARNTPAPTPFSVRRLTRYGSVIVADDNSAGDGGSAPPGTALEGQMSAEMRLSMARQIVTGRPAPGPGRYV